LSQRHHLFEFSEGLDGDVLILKDFRNLCANSVQEMPLSPDALNIDVKGLWG